MKWLRMKLQHCSQLTATHGTLCCVFILLYTMNGVGGQAVNVRIETSPAGIQVDGQPDTFDYPILSSVTLICIARLSDGPPDTVISYAWSASNCYTHEGGVENPCFIYNDIPHTTQSITGNELLATDAGTATCTATINDRSYTSDPLTLRISGVALIGGTEGIIVGESPVSILDDYGYILIDGSEQINATLFRCITGLGPSGNDSNDVIGDMYHNNVLLTDHLCNGFVAAQGAKNISRFPGEYQARICGNLTTNTEGIYTCTLTNSSMMAQSVSVGVYLSGRTAPVITATISPSLRNMDTSHVTLICTSSGSPPDTFTWMKDDVPVTQSSNIITVPVTYNSTVAVFSSSYTIAISDTGMYTCTVINPIGSNSWSFIVDHNVHDPMFDMEEYIVNVPEDTSPGALILTLTISDGDNLASPAGQVTNFALTGWDDAFIFVRDSLLISHVELQEPLDYEFDEMYNFTVTPTDNGLIPRSGPPAHIIIYVTDVNDNPPVFQQSIYNFIAAEESNVGMIIGTVSASDRDSGLNALLTYHIISAMPNGSFFTINNQTGEISILSSLDREWYSQHELVVVAMDQGLPSALTGLTTVFINITILPSLQETAQSINILVGQSVDLSCVPTPDDSMVNWTIRGEVIDSSGRVSLSPERLRHVLTIRSAAISDSGEYTCYLVDFPLLVNRTIRLNVLQGCQPDYIGGILWKRNIINSVARIRCSAFYRSFRPGVFITRMCNSNGEWGNVDYSSCTMRLEAVPLIMVEIKDIGSSTNATSAAVNHVTDYISGTNFTVLRATHQVYEISPSNISVIFVEVNNNSVPPNIITSLNNLLRSLSADTSVTGFQPSFQCSCTDVVMRNTLNYICYGPSVAPCTFVNGSYQCTALIYNGNGTLCGLDSDSDSFPDRQLDCTDRSCEQDECPYTFSGLTNSPTLCSSISRIGCQPENDTVWGIEWHFATAGSVAEGKCPGLSESSGLARRVCFENSIWDTFVNVTLCQSIELMVLNNIIKENQNILNSNTNNDTRDLTVLFDISEVEAVSADVSDLTNVSTAIVLNDINITNNIIDSLIRIIDTVVEANISIENTESLQSIIEHITSIIDNLLAISNTNSFEESRDMQLPVAEDLLRNIEDTAVVIGDVLDVIAKYSNITNLTIMQENIVFNAQLVPEDIELITDIIFPEVGDTQVIIPANAIIHQRASEGIRVPVVNYIAQNLQSYLGQTVSEEYITTSSSMVISSQISKAFIQLPENGIVRLKFNNRQYSADVVTSTLCVYWDFDLKDENNQTMGGWSSEGIIQDSDPDLPVLCNTTHLTSFSVLVSPKVDRQFESASALHVVSYIGCGISIFCLLLTVTAIVILRKEAFKGKHNKIHLNLSIALLLGLIVFVSGIETAKDNKIGCIVVTTLLHYLFLAVFCWAMCEGIIIYILFVEVFYKGIFQRLYFFLLLGWGLPIPIVAISLGLSHDRYGIKDDYGNRMSCWISDEDGAIWAFTAPMITILLINGVFLIASLWKIYQTRKNYMSLTESQISKYNIAKTLMWSILALLPLVCGTWILGLLFLVDSESEILAWIFTVINSLQGFAIFFFHVARNKEVSTEIKQRFLKWRKQQLLKSSLKDSTLERKQNLENFTLKRQESTKGVDNSETFVPSAFGPVDFTSAAVDSSAFMSDDELAVLTKKDFLQNDELY